MSKRGWRPLASAVGAGLIVTGLVTWSALANIFGADEPWTPIVPEPEWFQVGIGLGGLVGLWWTVIFARRAWRESRRAADAAFEANKGFAETTARQLRAYVVLSRVDVRPMPGGQGAIHVQPVFKNAGQTPTQRAIVQINMYRAESLPPAEFPYPDQSNPPQPITLGPGLEIAISGPTISTHDQNVIAMRHFPGTAQVRILVYGWIEYGDVFDLNARHRTEFCSELHIKQDGVQAHQTTMIWGPHNGIDAECLKQPQAALVASAPALVVAVVGADE